MVKVIALYEHRRKKTQIDVREYWYFLMCTKTNCSTICFRFVHIYITQNVSN